jgi:hypothetical protein
MRTFASGTQQAMHLGSRRTERSALASDAKRLDLEGDMRGAVPLALVQHSSRHRLLTGSIVSFGLVFKNPIANSARGPQQLRQFPNIKNSIINHWFYDPTFGKVPDRQGHRT